MYERGIASIVTTVNIVGRPNSVIAGAGVNYNGSLDMASNAGADCVKFQTFKADIPVAQTAPKPPNSKNPGLWVTLPSGPGASK